MYRALAKIGKKYRDSSLLTRFSVAYLTAILIPSLAIIAMSIAQTSSSTRETVTLTSTAIVRDVFENISDSMTAASELAEQLALNWTVRNYLADDFDFNADDILAFQQQVYPVLHYARSFQGRGVVAAKIVPSSADHPEAWPYFVSEERMLGLGWFGDFLESPSATTWIYPSESGVFTRYRVDSLETVPSYTYAQKIIDVPRGYLGTVIVDIPAQPVHDALRAHDLEDLDFALTGLATDYSVGGEDWIGAFAPDDIGREVVRDGYVYLSSQIAGTDLVTVARINVRRQVIEAARSRILVAAVIIVGLIGLEIGTYFIINQMMRRLGKVTETMNSVVTGEFHHRIEVDSDDEIGQISRDFNVLIRRIDELVTASVKRETLQKDTELKALQFQINPHFVYNTIDMFRMRLVMSGNDEIADAMADFGKMLRYNVSSRDIFTSLADEIDYAEKYIGLQLLRHSHRITFESVLDDGTGSFPILRFILQPLVENCIRHGLGDAEEAGISIRTIARRSGGVLVIEVTDDGVGILPARLAEIRRHLAEGEDYPLDTDGEHGIGLSNIRSRLKLHYGDLAGLDIGSEQSHGTTVTLTIPVAGDRV